MYATPNLNLTAWDQKSDFFDFSQLAADWQRIDVHNHNQSAGLGLQVGTSGIAALAVTTALVADKAITQAKLADASVGTVQLQDGSVTNAKLASGGVISGGQLTPGSVGFTQLDPNVQPLGTVLLWYRAPGDTRTPGGVWEPLDGRAWSSVANALGYSSGNMPDTRNAFPLGASLGATGSGPTTAPGIGGSGGTHTPYFGHAHTLPSHIHTMLPHNHAIVNDGPHTHAFAGGLNFRSQPSRFLTGITVVDIASNQRQNTLEGVYLAGFNSGSNAGASIGMDSAGTHNHLGATDYGSGPSANANHTQFVDPASLTTDLGSTFVDTRPQFVGFLFIMRVR